MKSILLLLGLLLAVADILPAQNLQLRSRSDYDPDLSDIWGWTDGEREYALIGLINAFTVVDVTNPDSPVKLFHTTVDGPRTFWRDIKTWGHYAFGVHDSPMSGASQGLAIMDLQYLPDSMPTVFWTGPAGSMRQLSEAHNIYIDENGYAYLAGHDYGGGGVLILDIATDPLNPTVAGQWQDGYVHDCFARGDTLWTSDGSSSGGSGGEKRFSAVDVSDKSNLVLLGYGSTPGGYSHNIWASDNGRAVFTTDESSGAYIAAHDVTDVTDMQEIDRYRSNPGSGVIPHNVHVYNDFLVISYYRDGVVVLDASQPDELVETGRYDTSPYLSGSGYNGCWGVYPYLPSGNILAADIERGLFVLTPDYKRAVHIRGTVRNALTGLPLSGVSVRITPESEPEFAGETDLSGKFKQGFAQAGRFSIEVSAPGFTTYTDTRALTNGDVLYLDIELSSKGYFGSLVWEDVNENGRQDAGEPGIAGAVVELIDLADSTVTGTATTEVDGLFTLLGQAPGNYRLRVRPPQQEDYRFVPTVYRSGDALLDNDFRRIGNGYFTVPLALTSPTSLTAFDAGLVRIDRSDPVDTLVVEVTAGDTLTVCDEALENGVDHPAESAVISGSPALPDADWFSGSPGCLTVAGGATGEAGPFEVVLVTTDSDSGVGDTTVFVVSVTGGPLPVVANAFDDGRLSLLQNPVHQLLYIRDNRGTGHPVSLLVSDLGGRELLRRDDQGFNSLISVRVDGLAPGMYLVSVYGPDGIAGTMRFIKR